MYGVMGKQRLSEKWPAPGCPCWTSVVPAGRGVISLVHCWQELRTIPIRCLSLCGNYLIQPLLGWGVMGTLSCTCKQGPGGLSLCGLGEKWIRPLRIPSQPDAKTQCQCMARLLPARLAASDRGACSALKALAGEAGVSRDLAVQAGDIGTDAAWRGLDGTSERSWWQRSLGLLAGLLWTQLFLFLDSTFLDHSPGF